MASPEESGASPPPRRRSIRSTHSWPNDLPQSADGLGGFMPNTQTLIAQAYSAFNHRDIDSALALMSENVSWPKASEGGRAASMSAWSCPRG
jgi:hypothetical protein